MASNMNKVAKELKNAINASDERKPKPYDTQAEVIRIEDKTAWVHIPGGIEETPVRLTINAKEGDMVNIHVANGSAWITGNGTNPPTDDTRAEQVYEAAGQSIDYVAQLVDKDVTVKSITAATGYIDDLYSKNIYTDNIAAATGYIGDLTAVHIRAEDIVADHETVGSLDANYAKINAANITDLSAQNAWVNKIMVQTGLIAHESDIFTLDAIQVNAANITAGTIDVNRLIVTVGNQKYLVNIDPSTGTPSYEKLDGNIVEPRTITADKIVAHDITVQEITTENLVGTNGWINLNQGTFFFTTNGTTWANTTNGIMWDGTNLKIKGDINITAGNVYTKTQTDTALGGKVGNNEVITKINASSEGVQIQASKVDIAGAAVFNNYSTTAQMNTAIGNAVDGIEVGGRNLCLASNKEVTKDLSTSGTLTIFGYLSDYGKTNLTVGTNVALSFDVKASTAGLKVGGRYIRNSSNEPVTTVPEVNVVTLTTGWVRYTSVFSISTTGADRLGFYTGANTATSGTVYIRNAKVEIGNKATDWTPAPEDVQAEIDTKKNTRVLKSGNTAGSTYSTIIGYAADGAVNNFTIDNTDSNFNTVSDVKVGDSIRLAYKVYNFTGTPWVYIIGTAIEITDATHVRIRAHGLDTTIIDGGNILTNSIGANQIAAHSIGASLITVSDSTNLATANELYESSLPTAVSEVYKIQIRSGYLTKKTATQQYLMLTDYTPNSFKTGDELYYEFVGKAAVAGTVQLRAWGYEGTPASPTAVISNGAAIDLTTANKTFSGVITLGNADWGNKTCYLLGFTDGRDTKSQIYIKNCVIRRKSAGELIVDGSITSDHISTDKIDANKIKVNQIQIGDLAGSIGGVNLLSNAKIRKTGTSNGITFAASSTSPAHVKITGTATADVDQWVADLQSITATGMSVTISANALFSNSTGIYFFVSTTKDGAFYKNYKQLTWYSNTERRLTIDLESGETLLYLRIFVPSGQTVSGNYRFKVELGNKQTAWTPPQDAYITDIGNDGIRIHSSTSTDNSVVIKSDGMQIYNGGTADANSVAKYGATARVGKSATRHIEIESGGMKVYKDASNAIAHIGYGSGNAESGTATAAYFVLGELSGSQTLGNFSVTEGSKCVASGYCSHAEGALTKAQGNFSHAEGDQTTVTAAAEYAHAEGFRCTASKNGAHAEGSNTTASGYEAHAEGSGTIASGSQAHAEGTHTTASGDSSHAGGSYTIAAGNYQTVIGRFNSNSTSNAFEIGNGVLTNSGESRSNALAVTWDGTVNIASGQSYKVNGTVVASARAKTTITPTASGVSNYSSYGNSYYEKAGNVVHVHIGVSGVTANTVTAIYTLPSGYRPTSKVFGHGTGGASDNIGYMDITTAGVISVRSSSGYIGADVTYFV